MFLFYFIKYFKLHEHIQNEALEINISQFENYQMPKFKMKRIQTLGRKFNGALSNDNTFEIR